MVIGEIKEIIRYPVKSFSEESVEKTKVMEYGLYGDRSHAFLDETRNGKYLTITQFPEMARYKAKFVGDESLIRYPKVEIETPEGRFYNWGDEELLREVGDKSKRNSSPVIYPPHHVPFGAIEEEHLLLVSDASLESLEKLWRKTEMDFKRFRPNLFLSLKEKIPFVEEKWVGRKLRIGSTVDIEIKRHCERCMIITVDPKSGAKDATLLRTIARERNNHFGVYASVIQTGEIKSGDQVFIDG